jgi:hypothetical protein
VKELKVFKDFESDIFFRPAKKNSLGRIDAIDRAKCLSWEHLRTLIILQPKLAKVVGARQSLHKCIKVIDKHSESKELLESISYYTKALSLLGEFENTRELLCFSEPYNKFLPSIAEEFPHLISDFPSHSYLDLEIDIRDEWECPVKVLEYKNITRKNQTEIFRNGGDYIEGDDADALYRKLVVSDITRETPKTKEEEQVRDSLLVSRKVPVEIYIDPEWTIGTLQNALRENVNLIHKLALNEKKKLEKKGVKFSSPEEYEDGRVLRTINQHLNFLGHYRLLEIEKWSWSEVASLFYNNDSSKNEILSSVSPISLDHYKQEREKILPDFNHSLVKET